MSSFNPSNTFAFARLCWLCILFLGISYPTQASDTYTLTGTWVGDNPLLTRVQIFQNGNDLEIVAFRACETGECDWGMGQVRYSKMAFSPDAPSISAIFLSAIGQAEIDLQQVEQGLLKATVSAVIVGDNGMEEIEVESILYPEGTIPVGGESTPVGAIEGTITGPAASTASLFQASVYGPDESEKLMGMFNLLEGMSVENLAPGTYWVKIEAKGNTAVQVVQDEFELHIAPGQIHKIGIELY